MLPTPAKFHYIFNLRDLSRIWQGMINTQSDVVTSQQTVVALWKHECMRVIADRFTNPQDGEWFAKTMSRVAGEELGEQLQSYVEPDHYFVDFLRSVFIAMIYFCVSQYFELKPSCEIHLLVLLFSALKFSYCCLII